MNTIRLAACALVALLVTAAAKAEPEPYPFKPIKLIVPGPPGGGTDILGRMVAEGLSRQLHQVVYVDNKAGASGMIGAAEAARSPADGYTLFMAYSATLTTNQWLYKKMAYDPVKDFAPIGAFAQVPNILVVNPSLPVHNVAELLAYAKAQPGKLNYASSYIGSVSHISMELLKQMTGADIMHVPFNGDAPVMTAIVGNQVQVTFSNTVTCMPMIQAGRLRAIAVAQATRTPVMPDLPPVGDTVPGFDTALWYGVMAPAGTPAAIVARLNEALHAAQNSPEMKARLAATGSEALITTPAELTALIKRDAAKIGKVVQTANIRPE